MTRRAGGGKAGRVAGSMKRMKKTSQSGNYVLERIRQWTYKKLTAVDTVKFKKLREATGKTQTEAAEEAAMTTQRWSDLENGRHKNPRVLTLMKVAAVLGCKVDDLLRK